MSDYIGKIVGKQNECCEANREVISILDIDEDFDIRLSVKCTVCGNTWIEVLD